MNSYWAVHASAQKITETTKLLKICCFVFILKLQVEKTEMIHQQRVSCLSHAVTERAVSKWCQRLPLAFVLQEDMLSKC